MSDFVHLHVHTQFSLLDGACKPDELLDRACELGQSSIAITDHGVMFGAQEFSKKAKAKGIKPIIGCEVYVAPRTRFDKEFKLDSVRYHLILLCKNMTGYRNLCKLVSFSFTEGFYTKPRVDEELLRTHSEGLICLSGCMFGEVQQYILSGDSDKARSTALKYLDIFGKGNYYLEIQNHNSREDAVIIAGLKSLSAQTGIPLAATNDVHYVDPSDAQMQKVLVCIQTNCTIDEDTGLDFASDDFYLKSEAEMERLFPDCPEAIKNTAKIAEQCELSFEYGVTQIPDFDLPNGVNHSEYLRKMCNEGLRKLLATDTPPAEYTERLDYELSVINNMGFCDYFLIVSDFISFAKSNGIPVGPGRGSAAGSLAAYCIGITGIDPIEHRLLFERFLNPERVSMPDIDIDICYERRQEVIDYCIKKYGADRVAQIITFNTMAARAAVRDVTRVLGLPYALGDTIARSIPRDMSVTLESALKSSEELRTLYDSDENVKRVIDTAKKIEGMPRHASTHAAGIVITRSPVSDYVPLAKNGDDVVTQYVMTQLEELGLLKMDLLGLRTLTVIDNTVKAVRKTEPSFTLNNIGTDYPGVYALLCAGNTQGVFQCESRGMTNLIVSLKPERFEDIAASLALYRPGPMYFIDDYVANRKNPSLIKYRTPELKGILDETCGCMVYQEQVMQVFRVLAGYSYGRADVVRRAMSKKKHDVMERERDIFINGLTDENGNITVEGAVRRGISAETADAVFSDMISFASYGFNKSHTAAYGLLAYQTAYLKATHPAEFMAALITSVLDDTNKLTSYISECSRLGIRLLPPDINVSTADFTVENGSIRFGMLGIKNIGRGLIERIVLERENNGRFSGFTDALRRITTGGFNRRAAENLIKSGACDCFGLNRRQLLQSLPVILDRIDDERRNGVEGQLNLFYTQESKKQPDEEFAAKPVEELPETELLAFEKEVTGIFISGHPLNKYEATARAIGCESTGDITAQDNDLRAADDDGRLCSVLGILTRVKKKVTKSDDIMAFASLEDLTGDIEVIVFPRILDKYASVLNIGRIVCIKGRISRKNDEGAKLIADTVIPADELTGTPVNSQNEKAPVQSQQKKRKRGLYIRLPAADNGVRQRLLNITTIFEGDCPVYFFCPDNGKYDFAGADYLTSPNEPMLKLLRELAGESSVVFWE